MEIDLDELERKARAATPGPWITNEDGPGSVTVLYDDYSGDLYEICTDAVERDAAHIAANSPPVTLALIAMIREREREAVEMQARLDEHRETAKRAERDALRTITIADEAFGIRPVESIDETLTRIERGIEVMRARIRELDDRCDRSTGILTFAIQDIVCSSCGHQHGGASVGRICIGCPCEERPGR